jgi:4-amino-4-deoxy-L-arabinose transferase-like glycosyltransferase
MNESIQKQDSSRKSMIWLLLISLIGFAVYFYASGNYGVFRDELYYFACGEHLDFGYVDHPPLVAVYAAISRTLFGDWLPGLRLLSTLSIVAVIFLSGWLARRLGGGLFAQIVTSLAVLVTPVYQGMSNFLSMNSFDILFWMILILILVEILKSDNPKLWLLFGVTAGFGFLNKYSVIFFLLAMVIALPFSKVRKHLFTPWPYIGAAIAVIIISPNIIWQATHGWPFLEFQASTTERTMAWITVPHFLTSQVLMMQPFSVIIWAAGLGALLFWKPVKNYRALGLIWIIALTLYILKGSKTYYPASTYLMLFPAGAMLWERLLSSGFWKAGRIIIIICLIISGLITLPYGLPVLPVESFIEYNKTMQLEGSPTFEDGRTITLRQHYADRFGWEEMVQEVARVYETLSDQEKTRVTIVGSNYGNAGAIDFFRDKYGLPRAISRHQTYYFWGTYDFDAEILITCGRAGRESLEQLYDEVVEAGYISHPYAIFYENEYPIYLCRGKRFDLKTLWEEEGGEF